MHTENFLNHQHDRQPGFALWRCIESRPLEPVDLKTGLTRLEAFVRSLDGCLRRDRHGGCRITDPQGNFERGAATGA